MIINNGQTIESKICENVIKIYIQLSQKKIGVTYNHFLLLFQKNVCFSKFPLEFQKKLNFLKIIVFMFNIDFFIFGTF